MKTIPLAAFLAATLLSTGAMAQSPSPATGAPNTVIYVPQLPSASELSQAAAAQGQSVVKIEQNSGQVTAVYKNPNGTTTTVAYLPLSTVESGQPSLAPAPAAAAPAPSGPPPTVIYQSAPPPVVYETPAPTYYYPNYWGTYPGYYYDPSLSFSFGYSRGWGGNGWGNHEWRERREEHEEHERGGGDHRHR